MRTLTFKVTEWFSYRVDPVHEGIYDTTSGFAIYMSDRHGQRWWWMLDRKNGDFMPGTLPHETYWRGLAA